MYTHREARSVTAESNIVLSTILFNPIRVRQSSEKGEGIDEMMHTIDEHVYSGEVKVYDVRIAQGQAAPSDVVEMDVAGYTELDST